MGSWSELLLLSFSWLLLFCKHLLMLQESPESCSNCRSESVQCWHQSSTSSLYQIWKKEITSSSSISFNRIEYFVYIIACRGDQNSGRAGLEHKKLMPKPINLILAFGPSSGFGLKMFVRGCPSPYFFGAGRAIRSGYSWSGLFACWCCTLIIKACVS